MHLIDEALNYSLRGEFKEAKKISDYLESLGPEKIVSPEGEIGSSDTWARHCFNRAWHFYQSNDFQTASKLIEYGRFLNCYGDGNIGCNKPIFNPEGYKIDSTVLVSLEGGYGDQIIQFRFLPGLKKFNIKKIILCSHPHLESIFKRNEWADEYVDKTQLKNINFDYWIPGFSLGWICGYEFNSYFPNDPYITPNHKSVEIWKSILNSKNTKLKVGIRWSGNPQFEHQQFRKFDPEYLINLNKYQDIELYSFQRDNDIIELPENITDLQHFMLSWEDTLAALQLMDLVITSCTSIAHASAAIGKETWVITPVLPYTPWANGAPESTTTPWYKTVKIFRQRMGNKWEETFNELYSALEEKIQFTDTKQVNIPNNEKVDKIINRKNNLIFAVGFANFGIKEFAELADENVIVDTSGQLFDTILYISKVQHTSFYDNNSICKTIRDIIDLYIDSYNSNNQTIIINYDYRWASIINFLNKIFGDSSKLLAFVRNPIEILAALELERINNPSNIDLDGSSLNERCMRYLSIEHPIGKLKTWLMDHFIQNFNNQICFVEYNNLINSPKKQFKRISEFFELENFTTDKKINKTTVVPTGILSVDIISKFGTSLFWDRYID